MDTDGGAFASGKLQEFIKGAIKQGENRDLLHHTGVVRPESTADQLLSELGLVSERAGVSPGDFADTRAAQLVRKPAATSHVGASVQDLPTFAVGLTDQDVEISEAQAMVKLARSLLNMGAPYIGLLFGAPNMGKSGFAALQGELMTELWEQKYGRSDGVVVSNMRAPFVDRVVTDFPEWRDLVLGDERFVSTGGRSGEPPRIDQERPIWWHFDECSTHTDARTKAQEVSTLYLPCVKRFAKARIDGTHIGHSTMDVYKDLRRPTIATEVVIKTNLTVANVYEHATEEPTGLKYQLLDVPESSWSYDPDDYSPWSW